MARRLKASRRSLLAGLGAAAAGLSFAGLEGCAIAPGEGCGRARDHYAPFGQSLPLMMGSRTALGCCGPVWRQLVALRW